MTFPIYLLSYLSKGGFLSFINEAKEREVAHTESNNQDKRQDRNSALLFLNSYLSHPNIHVHLPET